MHIRKAEYEDFDLILAIYNQSIPTHQVTGDLDFATQENRQSWFSFHFESKKYPLWVLEDENGVVGWCSFSPFYERRGFSRSAEISLYLEKKAKGKGYGFAMLQFMQEQMLTYNINVLIAYVFELNSVSYHLMKKCQFEHWATLPNIANMGLDEKGQHKWRTLFMMGFQKGIET